MGYEILYDPEHGVACLVEPEVGYAFGPLAGGPDPPGLLETFVGSLPADPVALDGHGLSELWRAFIGVATEEPVEAVPVAEWVAQARADAPVTEPPAEAETAPMSGMPLRVCSNCSAETTGTEVDCGVCGVKLPELPVEITGVQAPPAVEPPTEPEPPGEGLPADEEAAVQQHADELAGQPDVPPAPADTDEAA